MQREAEPIVISTTLSNKLAIFIVQVKTESWAQLSDGKPGKMEQLETETPISNCSVKDTFPSNH